MAKLWEITTKDPIVVDIETYDPNLSTLGPGVYHDEDAYVLGCGILDTATKKRDYYPLHARDLTPSQLANFRAKLTDILGSDRPKVLANAIYDLDWLENREQIPVNGFIHDVQVAEPLLNSYRLSYSLQALSEVYGVVGKQTTEIYEVARNLDPTHKSYKNPQELLWLMPTPVVGRYCCADLDATYEVLKCQLPLLEKEGLTKLYEVECNLVRICLMMRKNGIRIDQIKRNKAILATSNIEASLMEKMFSKYGTFNINSSREIAPLLLADGVYLPTTPTGQYSVTKDILDKNVNVSPLCADLRRCRAVNKLRTTFLEKSIDEHLCPDGRLHGQFYPLKKDDSGTVTGRWSGANPNLQQIPRNDEELGPMARGMFVPDEGCWYGHTDYSQVEYRVFSHYARGWKDGDDMDKLAQEMRDKFNANPHMDYHQFVIDMVKKLAGVILSRPTAKRVNFGVLYFMGAASLSNKFNIPLSEANEIYEALFSSLPFIESTRQRVVASAKSKGYVKTFCVRKQRVSAYHIARGHTLTFTDGTVLKGAGDPRQGDKFYPFFNYLIQGTAADIMKVSLVEAYRAGVYDVLKLHLLVHDETGTSIPKTLEGIQAYQAQQDILSNTVKLKVPILAEADYGISWGEELPVDKGLTIFQQMAKDIGVTL